MREEGCLPYCTVFTREGKEGGMRLVSQVHVFTEG